MRISKTKNNKQYFIIIFVTSIVLVGAYTGAAALYHLWPFSSPGTSTNRSSELTDESSSSSKSSDAPSSNSSSNTSKDGSTQNNTQSNPNYVDTPITNQPTNNDPYPITNEHYRIEQKSQTNYLITLYPIVNNPEYSDYNAQLRAYKTEALDYLKGRYGNIDSYNFEWSPSNAANL